MSGVPNLCEALRLAPKLGCQVSNIRATGEVRVTHPAFERPLRINGRRKDTPRKLLSMLRRLWWMRHEQSSEQREGPAA